MSFGRMLPVCFVACVVLYVGWGHARAGITVSPLKQEVTVAPGRTGTFRISVTNKARSPLAVPRTVSLEVMDFLVSRQGALSFSKPGSCKRSASDWIKISAATITLKPGEGREVPFEISVPYSARGEYYSAIMVTLAQRRKKERGVSVGFRIASGVFLTIPGRTFPKLAEVVECSATPTEADESGARKKSLRISAALRNRGQVRFEATGEGRIYGPDRKLVARLPLETKRPRVLPGDTRLFTARLAEPLPAGEYEVRARFQYGSQWSNARARAAFTITPAFAERWNAQRSPETPETDAVPAGLAMQPDSVSTKMSPGGFRRVAVAVTSRYPNDVRVEARFWGSDDSPDVADWVTLAPTPFVLRPGGKQAVVATMRIPPEAAGTPHGKVVFRVEGVDDRNADRSDFTVPLEILLNGRAAQ